MDNTFNAGRLRLLIGDCNITAVARHAGVTKASIYNWLNERNEPELPSVRKLAVYFDKPVSWFYQS